MNANRTMQECALLPEAPQRPFLVYLTTISQFISSTATAKNVLLRVKRMTMQRLKTEPLREK
jgi:hypothetical protein